MIFALIYHIKREAVRPLIDILHQQTSCTPYTLIYHTNRQAVRPQDVRPTH
jgi:hypothetical protein